MFRTRVVEKIKLRILCSKQFLKQNHACEMMWNSTVQTANLRHTRFACWLTKATNTH